MPETNDERSQNESPSIDPIDELWINIKNNPAISEIQNNGVSSKPETAHKNEKKLSDKSLARS